MAFIEWTPKFSVGSQVLDQQHKALIAIINELHAAMLRGGLKEDVQKIFLGLVSYTESHFKAEERIMERCGYPHLSAHRLKHVEFVQKARDLQADLLAGKFTVSMDLLRFLKNWLSEHILGTDQQYVPFLNPEVSSSASRT